MVHIVSVYMLQLNTFYHTLIRYNLAENDLETNGKLQSHLKQAAEEYVFRSDNPYLMSNVVGLKEQTGLQLSVFEFVFCMCV